MALYNFLYESGALGAINLLAERDLEISGIVLGGGLILLLVANSYLTRRNKGDRTELRGDLGAEDPELRIDLSAAERYARALDLHDPYD